MFDFLSILVEPGTGVRDRLRLFGGGVSSSLSEDEVELESEDAGEMAVVIDLVGVVATSVSLESEPRFPLGLIMEVVVVVVVVWAGNRSESDSEDESDEDEYESLLDDGALVVVVLVIVVVVVGRAFAPSDSPEELSEDDDLEHLVMAAGAAGASTSASLSEDVSELLWATWVSAAGAEAFLALGNAAPLDSSSSSASLSDVELFDVDGAGFFFVFCVAFVFLVSFASFVFFTFFGGGDASFISMPEPDSSLVISSSSLSPLLLVSSPLATFKAALEAWEFFFLTFVSRLSSLSLLLVSDGSSLSSKSLCHCLKIWTRLGVPFGIG